LSSTISSLSAFTLDDNDTNWQRGQPRPAATASAAAVTANNESAFVKFKVACKNFLRAMSSEQHPIVLFVDDIQWMDEGSKQLLTMFVTEQHWKNVLLIFAYRDEEADAVGDVLSGHGNNGTTNRIVDIQIGNLDPSAVYEFLTEDLGSSSEEIKELSDLVWHKTAGSPFHIIQLIGSIRGDGLLSYDTTTCTWEFDLDEIRKQSQISDSLADLLLRKVQRLSPEVQETCKVASLLGFNFGEEILLAIADSEISAEAALKTEDSISAAGSSVTAATLSLITAVDGGFLERTKDGYQFSHDKIQTCFQSMIDNSEKARLHRKIGELLLWRKDYDSKYHAANHMNLAFELVPEDRQRTILAQLNLDASKLSKEKSAFIDAANFLRRGLRLLNSETKWTDNFDLMFELTESLARLELIIGNLDDCMTTTSEGLLRSKSVHQKINLLLIDMEVRMATNDIDDSIRTANKSLNVLGIRVPRKIRMHHVILKLLKVKRLYGKKTDDQILSFPLMNDPVMAAAVRLLFYASTYCSMKNAENETLYYALLAMELTHRHGLSPHTAPSMATYGMIEVFLGNHMRGYRFGKLALKMLEQTHLREVECATIIIATSLTSHFQEQINPLIPMFDRANDVGLESGEVVWGVYSLSVCVESRCMTGDNLERLEAYMRERYLRAGEIGQKSLLRWSEPSMQYVLHLLCDDVNWRFLMTLNGDVMNEDEYIQFGVDANNEMILWTVWFFKMQLAYHFGCYDQAEYLLKELDATGNTAQANFSVPLWYYLAASIHYERHRSDPKRQRAHLASARKYHRAVQNLSFSPNSQPFLMLLTAEEMSSRAATKGLVQKDEAIVNAYNDAIGAMAEVAWPNMEGVANERVGFYLVRVGDVDLAQKYFDRAMYLYKYEWGAVAKYEWLLEHSNLAIAARTGRVGKVSTVVGNIIHVQVDD
jgi:predicted ATPase